MMDVPVTIPGCHPTAKVKEATAEGEENFPWVVEEGEDEHQLWLKTTGINGPLCTPLTLLSPLRRRG